MNNEELDGIMAKILYSSFFILHFFTLSLSPRYENSNIMAEIKSEETSEKKSLNFIEQIVENDLKEGKTGKSTDTLPARTKRLPPHRTRQGHLP